MVENKTFSEQAARIEGFKGWLSNFFKLKINNLAGKLDNRINSIFESKINGEVYQLQNEVTEKISAFQVKEEEINSMLNKLGDALDTQTADLTAGNTILQTDIGSADAIAEALKAIIHEIDSSAS